MGPNQTEWVMFVAVRRSVDDDVEEPGCEKATSYSPSAPLIRRHSASLFFSFLFSIAGSSAAARPTADTAASKTTGVAQQIGALPSVFVPPPSTSSAPQGHDAISSQMETRAGTTGRTDAF